MTSALPPLYETWMTQVLPGPIPAETQATCQQCVMCPPQASATAPSSSDYFHPQTKCCTYLPRLPNFLVGRILADEKPEMQPGRASVEQRIRKGVAVTPLGLAADAHFTLLYRAGRTATFGKSQTLRCPHYLEESGLCGIWRHREATCVTWFCKHVRGAVGMRFWHTLKRLLGLVEDSLAQWCVLQLEVGSEALSLLFLPKPSLDERPTLDGEQLERTVDLERYQALWGAWVGREYDFYRASAALVEALTWEEIGLLCGPEFSILLQLTQEAYHALVAETLPPRLQIRTLREIRLEQNACRLVTYRTTDPLRLPAALVAVLPAFDGRPLEQVRQTLASEAQVTLDNALLRKLVDFEVLGVPQG
ncbi:MAG TPA: hypothetical protein VH540_07425 [Ktedonobacterales bacterium]|jgi:hypothetical protein